MRRQADIWITKAEESWLDQLESNARQVFSGSWLPSHDHTHHRRVWNLCKRLLREMDQARAVPDYTLVEGVLIAAWFHDLGMASITGEKHGAWGRYLCESWLRDNSGPLPERYNEILDAVEFHDIKDVRTHKGISPGRSTGILPVLAVADDLEALGIIGIFRYTEIYLMRGIGMDQLGEKVLRNARHRMENLASCEACGNMLQLFDAEQKELTGFFAAYSHQLARHPTVTHPATGPAGVVNLIKDMGMGQHVRPEEIADKLPADRTDDYVFQYFKKLQHDWIQARC